MMVKPSVSELLTKSKNRYELVIATSKRARQIAAGAKVLTDVKEESPVTHASNIIWSSRSRKRYNKKRTNKKDEKCRITSIFYI